LRTYDSATWLTHLVQCQPLDASFQLARALGPAKRRLLSPRMRAPSGAAREGISAPRCRLTSLISPPKHNVGRRLAPVKERQHASVLIVPADPFHREVEAVLITTFRHKVEVLVGTVEHVDAAAIAGIGVEHLTSLILGEDADSDVV
jgi:hypothetical protein